MSARRRCAQCWKTKPETQFIGKRGLPIGTCKRCQARYSRWESKTAAERFAVKRAGVRRTSELRASLFVDSKNRKLGQMPSSMTSRGTCPPTCSFYQHGCYAEYAFIASHWRRVGRFGATWSAFCASVAALPEGQIWRHNVAGDLPGDGHHVDPFKLDELVHANVGRRGFTFTHYTTRQNKLNASTIQRANASGFTINLSADSLAHADDLADLGIAPVAVVVPTNSPLRLKTPAGRRVVICPAETAAELTCVDCQLCSIPTRKALIGFKAHGQAKNLVSEIVRDKRKGAA